ncbi:MAG: HD domain-containing protein [Desulfovermiculus sp.]|nr:HD domain-containing protein [Desulfovermiculus sp.]
MQDQRVELESQVTQDGVSPKQAAHRLQEFVGLNYAEEESRHQGHIDLKLAHSFRVWANVQQIAAHEEIKPRIAELAEISSVYHDVGRFPQYKKYRTFNDNASENHGRLGFKTLRQTDLLSGLGPKDSRIVLQSVFLHNRAVLPTGMPEALQAVVSLIRDADKLDIVGVITGHLLDEDGEDGVLTLGLVNDSGRYSAKILEQVRQGALVNYQEMFWVNDFKLLLCSWVFALNYPATRRFMCQRGEIARLVDSLPPSSETAELKTRLLKDLEGALASPR